jgi:hypothetical protein
MKYLKKKVRVHLKIYDYFYIFINYQNINYFRYLYINILKLYFSVKDIPNGKCKNY